MSNKTFGHALEAMKMGGSATRAAWNGVSALDRKMPEDRTTKPYLRMKWINGVCAAWLPSHSDILAEDWEISG